VFYQVCEFQSRRQRLLILKAEMERIAEEIRELSARLAATEHDLVESNGDQDLEVRTKSDSDSPEP
jgi:hypothetical protein